VIPTPRGSVPSVSTVEAKASDSPEDAAVPFWVTACVRLMPPANPKVADKVLVAAQALMAATIRVHGDEEVTLDRDTIALLCGYESSKKATWLFDYLQRIGFLTIYRHRTGRPGRPRDTFAVSRKPPAAYCGPRTFAELVAALKDHNRRVSLFREQGKTAGQEFGSRSGTKPTEFGPHSGTKLDKTAGQEFGSHSGTKPTEFGPHSGTKLDKTAGQEFGSHSVLVRARARFDQINSPSERDEGELIEPAPGGAAKPPAAGRDEKLAGVVREQIRRLPWRERARELGKTGFQLSRLDADQLQAVMCEAISRHGLTLEQAVEIARHALAKAESPSYVVCAFKPANLARWRRRVEVEPLADNPLPLPESPVSTGDKQPENPQRKPAAADQPGREVPLPACSTCGAREGTKPNFRTVERPDGSVGPCPDCLPKNPNSSAA